MNTYLIGRGTNVQVSTGSAFQQIPQIVSLTLPTIKREELDITSLESVGTEYGYGIAEASEMSFTMIYNSKNDLHAWLFDQANASTASYHAFKIDLPNSSSFAFSGSVMNAQPDALEPKKDQRWTFQIRPSNGVTFTK